VPLKKAPGVTWDVGYLEAQASLGADSWLNGFLMRQGRLAAPVICFWMGTFWGIHERWVSAALSRWQYHR